MAKMLRRALSRQAMSPDWQILCQSLNLTKGKRSQMASSYAPWRWRFQMA
jgi:hypothetical protein